MPALTRSQQIQGQKRLLLGASINPLGAGFIMGPVVSLLALHYGATDFTMGFIYAAVYLSSLLAILSPILLNGFEMSRIFGMAWAIRAIIGGGLLFLPFIPDNDYKILLLIVLLYGFTGSRAIGVTTFPAVTRALNRSNELTSFVAKVWSRWHFGMLIATIGSYIVLSNEEALGGTETSFMLLIGLAFVFNMITAWCYLSTPPIGKFQSGGIISLARAARQIARTAEYRDVITVTILQVALSVAAAYQLSHMQGPLAFSDGSIFALTLCGLIGAFLTSKLLVLLGDRISFRSLLFLTHFILCLCGLAWLCITLVSPALQDILAAILYVVTTMMIAMSGAVLAAMSNTYLPSELRLQVSTIYLLSTVVAAVLSLGIVALMRHLLADSLENPYAFAYIPWIVLCACICIWASLRKSDKDPAILSELQLLKPSNIQSMYQMQRVSQSDAPTNRHRVRQIEHAMLANTPASRESMLKYLESFHVNERLGAVLGLLDQPHESAYPILAKEAADPQSPLRSEAITALGFSNDPQHIPLLETFIKDKTDRIRSCTYKSLLRLGADIDDESIIDIFESFTDYRSRYEIIIGLSESKRTTCLRQIIITQGNSGANKRWLITLALQWADTFAKRRRLESFLQLELEREGEGIQDILLECASTYTDEQKWNTILEHWQEHHAIHDILEEHEQLWPIRDANDVLIQMLMLLWERLEDSTSLENGS